MSKDWKEIVAETNDVVWDRQKPIEGRLVDVKSDIGPNESMMYVLKTDKEKVSVWGSTVLDTKFQGIANGSLVRIEPQGKVKSEKTGREYQDFKVFVKPPEFEEVKDTVAEVKDNEPISLNDIPF
jgi:hypothetical protein